MAHIIITGATGLVGSAVLKRALDSPNIDRVSILSRRPVKLAENHPKAQVIIHQDFTAYPDELLAQLKGATGCVWAQGASSVGMKEEAYTRLTLDYPVAAAHALASLAPSINFVYISGEGAEMDLRRGPMFARVKGTAEKRLLELSLEQQSLKVYNLRPGGINPEGNNLAERTPKWRDRTYDILASVFERIYPRLVISTQRLARVSLDLATGDGKPVAERPGVGADGRLLRNIAIRALSQEPV